MHMLLRMLLLLLARQVLLLMHQLLLTQLLLQRILLVLHARVLSCRCVCTSLGTAPVPWLKTIMLRIGCCGRSTWPSTIPAGPRHPKSRQPATGHIIGSWLLLLLLMLDCTCMQGGKLIWRGIQRSAAGDLRGQDSQARSHDVASFIPP
jgi:hypothetical protein